MHNFGNGRDGGPKGLATNPRTSTAFWLSTCPLLTFFTGPVYNVVKGDRPDALRLDSPLARGNAGLWFFRLRLNANGPKDKKATIAPTASLRPAHRTAIGPILQKFLLLVLILTKTLTLLLSKCGIKFARVLF